MIKKKPEKNAKESMQAVGIKTGSFERRLSLTKAGLLAGSRMAGHMTTKRANGPSGCAGPTGRPAKCTRAT